VKIVISTSNLAATLQSMSSDHVDLGKVTRYFAHALARGYDNTVAYRKSGLLPANQVVDLYFRDFMADQVGTVRRAYEHFGMELSDGSATAMRAFLDANPADKHGKHLYSLAGTGMEEAELRALFTDYEAYFDVPREAL
jgi:hypothetical protein